MRLVVDASVAVEWLVDEEHSPAAKRLVAGPHGLHAPRLLASGVANALWRKARTEETGRSTAGSIADAVAEMPLRWCEDEHVMAPGPGLRLHSTDQCMTASTLRLRSASAAPTEQGGTVVMLTNFVTAQ